MRRGDLVQELFAFRCAGTWRSNILVQGEEFLRCREKVSRMEEDMILHFRVRCGRQTKDVGGRGCPIHSLSVT